MHCQVSDGDNFKNAHDIRNLQLTGIDKTVKTDRNTDYREPHPEELLTPKPRCFLAFSLAIITSFTWSYVAGRQLSTWSRMQRPNPHCLGSNPNYTTSCLFDLEQTPEPFLASNSPFPEERSIRSFVLGVLQRLSKLK